MKLNISYPATGAQKVVEIEDETKLRSFYDRRISQEVSGDDLGDEFKGYVFKISGGNDKQGFSMLQGVLVNSRVRLLFSKGMKCYRPRKAGERKRKSVRGCIVGPDLSVINLVITKKGDGEIAGLTDVVKPRRLGPKRANKIRALFSLTKEDDVKQYVVRRTVTPKQKEAVEGEPAPKVRKPYTKAPKIQRLITPQRLQRKRDRAAIKRQRYEKSKKDAEEYNKLVAQRTKEQREARHQLLSKKRSLSRSQSQTTAAKAAPAPAAAPAKAAAPAPVKKAETKAAPAPKAREAPKAVSPAPKKEKISAPKAAAEKPKTAPKKK